MHIRLFVPFVYDIFLLELPTTLVYLKARQQTNSNNYNLNSV